VYRTALFGPTMPVNVEIGWLNLVNIAINNSDWCLRKRRLNAAKQN
jgi:hypothetical protein